jgi:hypothetical protein
MADLLHVDPATLYLPGSRRSGADPHKLWRQLSKYGASITGMPPIEAKRCADGKLIIYDGVTRATRAAKYASGALVPVLVTGQLKGSVGDLPTVGEKL